MHILHMSDPVPCSTKHERLYSSWSMQLELFYIFLCSATPALNLQVGDSEYVKDVLEFLFPSSSSGSVNTSGVSEEVKH